MLKILATLDGSSISEEVMPVLEKLTGDSTTEIVLLTVVDQARGIPAHEVGALDAPAAISIHELPTPELRVAETREQAITRARDEARDRLEHLAVPFRNRGIRTETEVEVDSDAARAIGAAARKHGVDLIAMATHGRSGLSAVIQGSVAAKVVASGVAPVLLVKPKGR